MTCSLSRFCWTVLACCVANAASAAVIYTSGTYSQNFDSLPSTGTAVSWTNDSTLPGWSLFIQSGAAAPSILVADGSGNTGSFNSFGTTGSTDRALGGTGSGGAYFGSPASAAVAGWWAVDIANNTGSTLDSFTLKFDGEQWRNGGNTTAQTTVLQYGFGATFGAVSNWILPGGSFDFTGPIATATQGGLDGNAAANRTANLGGTISNLTWTNGSHLWVRWVENNDVGNDHGMGIDNFSFSAHSVPEPTTVVLGSLGFLGLVFGARRGRQS